MTDTVDFSDESRDRSILRKADYDDADPKDLVLTVPKRDGGKISIPLLKQARSNVEREDYQENTLLRVKPLAEIDSNLPVKSGGVTIYQGKGVALLRPGYLYAFRKDRLWRELEISQNSQFSDIDLQAARAEVGDPESGLRMVRPSAGQWLDDVLVPVFLQGQAVMHDFRMAYSEVQWDWAYVQKLEESAATRNARTTGVGHAWAVTSVDSLSFETGFPASRVEDVPELRHRDLGIELMIENPSDFVLSFERPGEDELCSKLAKLLESNEKQARESARRAASRSEVKVPAAYTKQLMKNPLELALEATAPDPLDDSEESEVANILDLFCPPGADLLQHLRSQKGVVCVAIPDPLFRLRHSLAQLQLALHYLDAIDVSIQERPLVHSAMLIRQALFDPQLSVSNGEIDKLRSAVDQEKLHNILEHSERQLVFERVSFHLATVEGLIRSGEFDGVCSDYLNHNGLGPCEAFALQANLIDLLQQLPGVLSAQGFEVPVVLTRLLQQGLDSNFVIEAVAGREGTSDGLSPLLKHLRELAQNQEALTEERLRDVGLTSISALTQQLKLEEGDTENADNPNSGSSRSIGAAGTVAGMLQAAVGGWSSTILKSVERLRQSGDLTAIKLDRVFTSVVNVADIADPNLGGELQVMRRGAVDLSRFSIVGVHGNGLSFGLTDADIQSEALSRRNDYLFADRIDAAGNKVASTSPARLADEIGEAVLKAAAHTWVFVLPIDHVEARKFSALRIDWAKKAKAFADGPALSRVLVGLAAYNLASEVWSLMNANSDDPRLSYVKSFGAILDLSAALMKLHVVSSPASESAASKLIMRPLFEITSVPLIGPLIQRRLLQYGAGTVVRTMGLTNFLAGVFMVGVSAWDYRNSFSRGDLDAALGHGLAVVGGSIFVFSKLLHGLLLVPGWGWALFGLGLVLGGSIYAAAVTDSEVERVLKQGPLGVGPDHPGLPADDVVYYSQLLSILSPITLTAKRYEELSESEKAMFSEHNPSPDDYRVTVSSPIISRFKLGRTQQGKGKINVDSQMPNLRLGVQELEYTHSTFNTSAGDVNEFSLTRKTTMERITSWVALPDDNSVHFLIERKLTEGENSSYGYREQRTINLRVVLQARVESEIGGFSFPMPVLDEYEPYDKARHEVMPDKTRQTFNPYNNEPVPYWLVKEVAV